MFERVRRTVLERLPGLVPMRRRLVDVPLGLDHTYWIEDPNFDVDFHVRHLAVPRPVTTGSWPNSFARLHSRPLDRSMPLWELYVTKGCKAA